MLRLTIGRYVFGAKLETGLAPRTCEVVRRLLPMRTRLIHVRWSGEAMWIPGGDAHLGIGYENNTSHPAPGDILLYPGGQSEMEILVPYGPTLFSSKAGQLSGNHFGTIVEGREQLRELGQQVLWEGAQEVEIIDEQTIAPGWSRGPLDALLATTVERFWQGEREALESTGARPTHPVIAAIGTLAPKALGSPLLRDRLATAGIVAGAGVPHDRPAALLADPAWALALVLSPFKRELPALCERLTPAAAATGVVDTLLRVSGVLVGVNSNVYAASAAIQHLVGGSAPRRALIAGTGASARSVAVGLRKVYPWVELGFVGRSSERAAAAVAELGAGTVVVAPADFGSDLVVNATTVGESDDAAELAFDLGDALVPGVRYLDLNNRTSALQTAALSRGCITSSGIVMQILTNALRIALLQVPA